MYRLKLLGGLDLRGPDGAEIRSVLAQPKRFALLVYLAIASPRGPHRRDRLLALFWPEASDERARDALNSTLYHLRRSMSADAVTSRGKEDIGIGWDVVWSDVRSFEDDLDAGRFEAALQQYQGELAPGFSLPEAPEFNEWLDAERRRLREAAQRAAFSAANAAAEIDDHDRAARLALRAWRMDPTHEVALQKAMGLLERAGDRAGALQIYEEFARKLRVELDAEPSPQTAALAAEIRSRLSAVERPNAPAPVAHPVTLTPPPPAPPAPPTLPGRPSNWYVLVAAGAVVLVTAVLGAREMWRRVSDPAPRATPVTQSGQPPAAAAVSPNASQAFAQGEAAYRAGQYARAVTAFQSAVDADSGFALAYLRLSNAANWTNDNGLAVFAADQAYERRARLSEVDRLHAEAWRAYVRGAADTAIRIYQRILARDSLDAHAWLYLGEAEFHWGPQVGVPAQDAARAFRQAVALDPQNAGALIHLARLAAGGGRREEFDRLGAALTALDPQHPRLLEIDVLRAFAFGDHADRVAVATKLARSGNPDLRSIAMGSLSDAYDLDGAADLLMPPLLKRAGNLPERAHDFTLRAEIELARGRLRAADAWLDSAGAIQPGRALEYRAMIRTLPFVHANPAELRQLRDEMRASPVGDWSKERGPAWRLYLRGLLSVRLGELDAAEGDARVLEASRDYPPIFPEFARGFARLVRAEVARAKGQPKQALDILGAPRLEPDSILPMVLSYARAHERWLRAEVYREAGQNDTALQWYRTFPDPSSYDLMYLAPVLKREAALSTGDEARRLNARAAALWREAESPFRLP